MYRQGDVLLVPISREKYFKLLEQARGPFGPLKSQTKKDLVLAEGEATGHNHVLKGEIAVLERNGQPMVVAVAHPTQLVHQEHDTVDIPPGHYEVVRQEEYTPQGSRMVWD